MRSFMVNPSIFKSYDIRGIYPSELNEDAAYKIGQAFVNYSKAKKIVVGRDVRISSPALFEALVKGITSQGIDVYDIGQVPVECLYFSIGRYEYDGAIMITASHNPKEYNGMKMMRKTVDGIAVIRGKDLLEAVNKDISDEVSAKGKIKKADVWPDFLDHIFSLIDVEKIKPLKVVIDTGNGAGGTVIPHILPKLPGRISVINLELDGNFPNRPPNPLAEGASKGVSQAIKEQKADMGFMFDGDADRVFLVDENGDFVKADVTLLILAKYFLNKYPGAGIAYNLICSKAVPEFVKKWGGVPIRTKVGFVNVREAMIENNGVLGGELSAHYCFKDHFYFDSGFAALLTLLQIFSQTGKKVSEIVAELSPYAKASEVNFQIEDKEAVINKIQKEYSDGRQDFLDGLTVEYKDWWFNLRLSQTEPVLRLTIEADSQGLLEQKVKELADLINE